MGSLTKRIIVNNIKLPTDASIQEAFSVSESRLKKAGIKASDAEYKVYRRSVDARVRGEIKFVYSVLVTARFSNLSDATLAMAGASVDKTEMPVPEFGDEKLQGREGSQGGSLLQVVSQEVGMLFT